jgi:predicted DNA-binding mobile mystery protein A
MKTSKKAILSQRRIMDQKLKAWLGMRQEQRPPMGWLRAVRGALGMSARQLGKMIGIDASAVVRMEEREQDGKVTLELLDRAARAMDCRLVYAIVPNDEVKSLEEILESRARSAATEVLNQVEHSMRLEDQGTAEYGAELEALIQSMKEKNDSRIWALSKAKPASQDEE